MTIRARRGCVRRREALRCNAVRPRPRRPVRLVVERNASVQDAVGIGIERDDAVAGLARVAVPTTDSARVRNARSGPRESTVRRAVHEDATRVVLPLEADLPVVRSPAPVEDRDRVAAPVDVILGRRGRVCARRREVGDAVVPVVATVGRRIEARRAQAEPVVVGPAEHVARVRRVDGDAHLVLRHAREVLVQTHVVASVAEPLDRILVRAPQAPISDSRLRTLGDVRSERDVAVLDTARNVGRLCPRREISPSATRRMGRCGPS